MSRDLVGRRRVVLPFMSLLRLVDEELFCTSDEGYFKSLISEKGIYCRQLCSSREALRRVIMCVITPLFVRVP